MCTGCFLCGGVIVCTGCFLCGGVIVCTGCFLCGGVIVCTGCFLFGLVGVTLGGGFGTLNKVGMAHHMIPAFLLSLFLNCDSSK